MFLFFSWVSNLIVWIVFLSFIWLVSILFSLFCYNEISYFMFLIWYDFNFLLVIKGMSLVCFFFNFFFFESVELLVSRFLRDFVSMVVIVVLVFFWSKKNCLRLLELMKI